MEERAARAHEAAAIARHGIGPLALARAAVAPALALAAVALALATQFAITRDADVPKVAVGFAVAAALLGAAVFVASRQERDSDAEAAEFELPRAWEIALVIAVIGLAVFFRFYRFMEFPPGVWYDEAVNGTDAITIIERDHLTVWRESNFGHSTIFFYLLIVSFKLFGFTVFAMRMVPALAGMAAVVGFYFLARWLLGAVPALVATALLAVSRFAVTFSRISWEASLQPLLEIMAVFFLVRALETRNRFYFFMAGGSLAAGIYTYLAFRFVPVVMAFLLLYVAVSQWPLIRRNLTGLVVYAVSFIVVITPLAQYAIQNQDQFLARTRDVNVFKEIDRRDSYEPLRYNIEASFKMMNVTGDLNGRHNLPRAPMLDEISAALLALGVAVGLWSARDWRKGGMLGWLALSLIPGALTISIENPSAIRAVGAIPPLFLIAGMAVGSVYRTLSVTVPGRLVFGIVAAGIVAGATVINYHDFFVLQYESRGVYDGFQPVFRKIGELVADEAGERRVYVSREFNGHPAVRVLGRGKNFGGYTPNKDLIFARTEQDVLLVLDTRQIAVIPTLRRLYPNLTTEDEYDPFDRLEYTRVLIPASDVAALHAVTMTLYAGTAAAGTPTATERRPLGRNWTGGDLAGGPVTAVWEGYLWAHAIPGVTTLTVQSPGPISIELDGTEVAAGRDTVATEAKALPAGQHRLRIVVTVEREGVTTVQGNVDGVVYRDAAELAYGVSAGDYGFQAVYRKGTDFSAEPELVTQMPFAVGALAIQGQQAVEYRGLLDVPDGGEYRFALDGATSAQLFIDDELIVDNGGGHSPRRIESSVELGPGEHALSVQYTLITDRSDWAAYVRAPGEEWRVLDGTELRVPPGPYRPPAVVRLEIDGDWGISGRTYEGLDQAVAVTVLPDGTAVVGWVNRLVFVAPDGTQIRTLKLDVNEIADLAVTADGRLAVLDGGARSLIVLGPDDQPTVIVPPGGFESAAGFALTADTAYVASPAGGIVYAVPLAGGAPAGLPLTQGGAPDRPLQPSDTAVAPDGTLYLMDFERKRIYATADGVTARTSPGLSGTGVQVPRMAIAGGLVYATDPTNQRIVVYDLAGKQRGVFVFPAGAKAVRPVGVAVGPDGLIYVADIEHGAVFRLRAVIPPETAAELSEQ